WLFGCLCSPGFDQWCIARISPARLEFIFFGKGIIILSSIKKAWIAAAVAVIFAGGLIIWQVKARRSEFLTNVSAEDMALIAEDQPPQFRARLATDEASGKSFAENMRHLLAVDEEARLRGAAINTEVQS